MSGSIGSATSAPHLLRERQSHATCASDFVPSSRTRPRARRARAQRAARRLDDLPDPLARAAPSRPPDSVDSVIARESPHASRRVACGRAERMPMRAETVSARGRSGSFPATRGRRSRLAVGSGTVERAAVEPGAIESHERD